MLSADQLYDRLETEYGEPGWWSDDPFTVMFQSVLVQNTAWTSVVRTCGHIGGISPERITSMSREELEDLIRPCGFARSKSAAIRDLAEWFGSYGNDLERVADVPTDELRTELLSIRGVGEETADTILVYAFRRPRFVVDAYARRLMGRLGCDQDDGAIREYFESGLGHDAMRLGGMHRLILEHGIARCGKRPKCDGCPLSDLCMIRSERSQRLAHPDVRAVLVQILLPLGNVPQRLIERHRPHLCGDDHLGDPPGACDGLRLAHYLGPERPAAVGLRHRHPAYGAQAFALRHYAADADGHGAVVEDYVRRHGITVVELHDEALLIHEDLLTDADGILGEMVGYLEPEHRIPR